MFQSIMVPLDRSAFAEQALPWALSIAQRAHARIDLAQVHVMYALEGAVGFSPYSAAEEVESGQKERLYLEATAKWLTSVSTVPVDAELLDGSAVMANTVADAIARRAQAKNEDLLVLATHDRIPVDRFFLGSVSDELMRYAAVPLLLIHASKLSRGIFAEPELEHVLIPLDGSELAEQILEPALHMARLMEARCTLMRVIGPRASERERREADAYLEQMATRAKERNLPVQTRLSAASHAADAILEALPPDGRTMVALATHGRGGVARMLRGSVADKVLRTCSAPLLVFRPKMQQA
ncbi:MAG TPA: universal stress protein [Gemmataceae bacterium]|nr:universal stress protein [Gemmataceae bacterium]